MKTFSAAFITMAAMFGIGYLIMIFGWGLEARSWGWILGGGFVQIFISAVFKAASES